MKFSCEKSTLLDAVNISSRAVSGKSAIALLEGLLIQASDRLELTGYDLTLGIRTTVDADVIEPGAVVLGARILGDIIRKLPDETVYIETDEKLLTTIQCGRAVFNLIASPADDFPQMPEVSQENFISLPEHTLKSMISQTIFAVSDNESKPIHTGCLFETEAGRLNVAAVDGYRLSVRREALESPAPDGLRFVVPGVALREIERILTDADAPVSIYPDSKHILFSVGDTVLITRLIDGEFLNYRAAIPADADYQVGANVRSLITCVERVSLIVSEKLKNPVRLHFDGDTLKMSCITAIGKSYDECTIDGSIENLEIGFNNRYLLDALRACQDETVILSLKGALNPMVVTPVEGDKFTYLVLPVRLKAGE
ncbi:MAG: DNA polymerase III subunit beta [Intestinibacillus sp.]